MQELMPSFLDILKQRVLVYDGAMGTSIQGYDLSIERDYAGLENCSEILAVTRPDVIGEIHRSYLEAGADVIETDSFGASSLVLAEFGIPERARELNLAAARVAREAANEFSTAGKPRFVAGSIGPTTKLPSLGHIGYDAMLATYVEQAEALIEGGVDVLLIETSQDLLQAKIALAACHDAMHTTGITLPIQMQITMEATGTMLLGSEIGAALAVLECFRPNVVGLNCATGPKEMNDAVRFLCQNATMPVSVLPNAGLPQNVGGRAVYGLKPGELAEYHRRFVTEYGVQVVGGCCGTTPEHIRMVAEAVANATPAERNPRVQSVAASAFSAVPARSRRTAGHCGRGDEYHHAAGALPRNGPIGRLRRHLHHGQAAGERGLADARSLLRDCGRGREGLHERGARKDRDARARADPGGFDRG